MILVLAWERERERERETRSRREGEGVGEKERRLVDVHCTLYRVNLTFNLMSSRTNWSTVSLG